MSMHQLILASARAGGMPELAEAYAALGDDQVWADLVAHPDTDPELAVTAAAAVAHSSEDLHRLTRGWHERTGALPAAVQVALVSTDAGRKLFSAHITAPEAVAAVLDHLLDPDHGDGVWLATRLLRRGNLAEVLDDLGAATRIVAVLAQTTDTAERTRLLEVLAALRTPGAYEAVPRSLSAADLARWAAMAPTPEAVEAAIVALTRAADAGQDVTDSLVSLAQLAPQAPAATLAAWLLARDTWPGDAVAHLTWERIVAPHRPASWWATIPAAEVPDLVITIGSAPLPTGALVALVGRRDVDTATALSLLKHRTFEKVRAVVAVRGFDPEFVRGLARANPALLAHLDAEAALDVLRHAPDGGLAAYLHTFDGSQLTDAQLLSLPWAVLFDWSLKHDRVSAAVQAASRPLLADAAGREALAQVLDAPAGDARMTSWPYTRLLAAAYAATGLRQPAALAA